MTENNERTETKHVAPRRSVHLVTGSGHRVAVAARKPRVVHTGLLTADVDGILFRTLPDFFGGFFHAVGQDIAEAFSLNNLLGQRHDRLMIPPFQVDAAGILLRQNTFFI